MTDLTPIAGMIGGVLLGLSAVLLMSGIGRIAGVSGIFSAVISGGLTGENAWRWLFIAGLLAGTALTALATGFDVSSIRFPGNLPTMAVSGLMVGVGTVMGSGCTSGHGVCGLARLSPRSLVSTVIFFGVAVVTVFIMRHALGG
ncbi:MAG: YeeE/YedE family protein [Aestuariivirga sp.]|uniref:YeeE/YedE family protein n=1 Tax=Aestuariivirga sp. TaxID=2650926 RepID=UPI0038D1D7A7